MDLNFIQIDESGEYYWSDESGEYSSYKNRSSEQSRGWHAPRQKTFLQRHLNPLVVHFCVGHRAVFRYNVDMASQRVLPMFTRGMTRVMEGWSWRKH